MAVYVSENINGFV